MISLTFLMTTLLAMNVPDQDALTLTCIAFHESSLRPYIVNHHNRNGTKDYGLFQINTIWLRKCRLNRHTVMEVGNNINCALYIYRKQGLKAWVTLKHCR